MTAWPLHDYDPRPANRRLRRAVLVLGEHLRRAIVAAVDPGPAHNHREGSWRTDCPSCGSRP